MKVAPARGSPHTCAYGPPLFIKEAPRLVYPQEGGEEFVLVPPGVQAHGHPVPQGHHRDDARDLQEEAVN